VTDSGGREHFGLSRLRVLAVIDSLGAGGAEFSLVEMLPRLTQLGIELRVVCLVRREEGAQTEMERLGVAVQVLEAASRPARLSELRTILRSARPDLVHTTLFESDVLGRLAAIGTGVPVVTSLVNVSYEDVRLGDPNVRRWRLRSLQAIDAVTARLFTHGFHALTQTVADSSVRRLGIKASKITVVPRSRGLERLRVSDPSQCRRTRSKLGIPPDAEVILTVGRQEYQKGQRHLVEAFSNLAEKRPRAWLVIAGRAGNASEDLQGAVGRASGADRILVLGHRTDVPELLHAADVFAFPSLYEGLGGSLLEAMAAGLPIVASDIPAIREVADGTVLVAAPGDADQLENRLERLFDDPALRRALGILARRRFDQHPTLDQVAEHMAAWYRRNARQSHSSTHRKKRRQLGQGSPGEQ